MFYVEEIKEHCLVGYTKSERLAKELNFNISLSEDKVELAYNGAYYLKGYAPKKPEPTVEEQNEAIRQERQRQYVEISDPLKMDYDEALARGEATADEKKQAWLSSKDKIREENPYIEVK